MPTNVQSRLKIHRDFQEVACWFKTEGLLQQTEGYIVCIYHKREALR